MTWRQSVRRTIVAGMLLISVAQVTAMLGGPAAAQEGGQTAPTATAPVATTAPTPVVPVHRAGGRKGSCTNGIGMGQLACGPYGSQMHPPSTGGGGTARIVVPARLPQTGGGEQGSNDDRLLVVLAVMLLAAGIGLAGRARRTSLLR